MSSFSALGAASGLPLEDIVNSYISVERNSKLGRVETQKKRLDASISAFGKLKSALTALQDAAKNLSGTKLTERSVSIVQPDPNKTFIEATAKNGAPAASFDVQVQQLAYGSRLESADLAFTSANDVISTVDSTLSFSAGDKTFQVDVTAGMTLDELRNKINSQGDNFGVNVNIVNAGGSVGTKLVFNSAVTGAGNELTITSDNTELDNISTQASGGGSGGLSLTQAAQDAIIQVDGITAVSSSNVFTDVVQDISITAKQVTPTGNNAQLTVGVDSGAIKENLQAFIDKYNALVSEVKALTKAREISEDGSVTNENSGVLNGDSAVRSIMGQLNRMLGSPVSGADDTMSTLYSVGISLASDGSLEIKQSAPFGGKTGQQRFDEALDNIDGLSRLFGGSTGLASSLDTLITDLTETDGLIGTRESSLNRQLDINAKERERVTRYLESYEQTMRSKYIALDSLLGRLNNTSSFVTSQLSSLPGFGGNKE